MVSPEQFAAEKEAAPAAEVETVGAGA
jgi:hypothetical protein